MMFYGVFFICLAVVSITCFVIELLVFYSFLLSILCLNAASA